MPPLVTFVIPVAPHHEAMSQYASSSVLKQTIPCDMRILPDNDSKGAGWARNLVLRERIRSPFIAFLDADDTVKETFVEDCLRAYQTGRYVYTSWMCGSELRKPNMCAKYDEGFRTHLVTTLYPTEVFRALGGFDESLNAIEDYDFYMRSAKAGVCGVYLDKPLVNYSEHGQRSETFLKRHDYQDKIKKIWERNGGDEPIMACCGQAGTQQKITIGEALPGDVMAETLWGGMRSEVGPATKRVYRGGNGSEVPVAPEDLAQMGHLLREVKQVNQLAPKRESVLKEAGLV